MVHRLFNQSKQCIVDESAVQNFWWICLPGEEKWLSVNNNFDGPLSSEPVYKKNMQWTKFWNVTGWYDEVGVEPRSVSVDHEVWKDEGVQGLLAEPVIVAVATNSLVNKNNIFLLYSKVEEVSVKKLLFGSLKWSEMTKMIRNDQIWSEVAKKD